MKTIAVVATEKEYAEFLKNNITKYMSSYASFVSYSISEVNEKKCLSEDFVLLSAFNIFQQMRQKISTHTEIIVLTLSLSKKQIQMLERIPKGTKALLVNYDNRTCMHAITCMYDAGIRDIELIPYYGQDSYDTRIKVAITPNEEHLVPKEIETIYNIGESSVDMNSLYNIADKLGVYKEFIEKEANEARKEYYKLNSSMDRLLDEKEGMKQKLSTVLQLMNEGIIIADADGYIYSNNEKAQKLLVSRTRTLQGFTVEEVLPEIDLESTKDKLIRMESGNLIISVVKIKSSSEMAGHVITISDFEEVEEKQHGMRSKLREQSQTARCHFEDIVGKSVAIKKIVEDAKRMSFVDSTIVITGESGTGKEIFAQSIHNASRRKKYNFVAVNCAAIPDNLLESEMFGYEEGSFTGARKGGKIGFFELAHKGTIFLDEIGEMPMILQSKLLRVLEEQKVMRVGGNRNIDIDVRVICATNKDLLSMVDDGTFREDLYYRINVLPLHIPPLRERKEDIIPGFHAFARQMNQAIQLSAAATEVLENYEWGGNVRELRNVVEFLVSTGKTYIERDDLPVFKRRSKKGHVQEVNKGKYRKVIDNFLLHEGKDIELYYEVLKVLRDAIERGEHIGRQKIQMEINKREMLYTEGEIRKALSKLSEFGFIRALKGRGGSAINREGIYLLEAIENFNNGGSLM